MSFPDGAPEPSDARDEASSVRDTRLPRSVWVLSGVAFLADIASEMVYPLMPLFLVGALHATMTEVGAIEGAAGLLVAVMSAVVGVTSDRLGRRVPWIRAGYGLPVIGKAVIALASGWLGVFAGRLLDRVGKGLRGAPRDALIASLVPAHQRGRAFGMHRAFDTAGALVGVVLSAVLLWALTGTPAAGVTAPETPVWVFRALFGLASGLGLLSFALTLLIEEAPGSPAGTASHPRADTPLPRAYWAVLGVLVVFSMANSSDMFLLLRASDVGLSPWAVVMSYALFNVVYAAGAYPAGWISDRLGRWGVIAVGWCIYAAVYAGFSVTPAWGVFPLMALYGAYMALTEGVGKALLADHVPAARRGAAMGGFYAATGATTLVSSLVAGALWDWTSPARVFELGAAFAVLALLLLAGARAIASKKVDRA